MKNFQSVAAFVFGVVFAAMFTVAVAHFGGPPMVAYAQQAIVGDTWSGQDDRLGPVTSITVTSTAQLIAAVTNKKIVVKAIDLASSQAGAVQLQDGSGGATIYTLYLAANTPRTIYEDALGKGATTTSGNGLYAVGPSTAVLVGTIRYQVK